MAADNAAQTAPRAPADVLAGLTPVGRRILDAAREVVTRGGLDGLSLQTVATEAGVHKSAIAYHFGSKDGLLQALAEQLFEEYPPERAERPAPAADAAQRVAHRFGVLRRLAKDRDYWSLAHALWSLTQIDASFALRAEQLKRRHLRRVAVSLGLRADAPGDLALLDAVDAAVAGLALDFTFGWGVATIDASLARLEEAFTPLLLEALEGSGRSGSAAPADRPRTRAGEAG